MKITGGVLQWIHKIKNFEGDASSMKTLKVFILKIFPVYGTDIPVFILQKLRHRRTVCSVSTSLSAHAGEEEQGGQSTPQYFSWGGKLAFCPPNIY